MIRYSRLYEDDPKPKFKKGDIVLSKEEGVVGKVVDIAWFVNGFIVDVSIIHDNKGRRNKGNIRVYREDDVEPLSGNMPTELGEVPTELYA